MTEKTVQTNKNVDFKKDRFEFMFKINGNIICQRYFYINGFKKKSLNSLELVYGVRDCVNLIKKDLREKSAIFQWNTTPQIYKDEEQMYSFIENGKTDLEVPSYIILEDSDKVFVWDGKGVNACECQINREDYIPSSKDEPCTLSFSFLVGGREVVTEVWDGNIYPRFVRNNIDITNSKNRYEGGEIYAPFEATIIKLMIANREDLVPKLIDIIVNACSNENDDYTVSDKYGDTVYSFNPWNSWNQYVNGYSAKYKKKTDKYFNDLKFFTEI